MTTRVGLRSHFVPKSSRNDVDSPFVPEGNGVDGNGVARNRNGVAERSHGNEVVARGTALCAAVSRHDDEWTCVLEHGHNGQHRSELIPGGTVAWWTTRKDGSERGERRAVGENGKILASVAAGSGGWGCPPANVTNAQGSAVAAKPVNVRGGSRDPNRGTWCTPKPLAEALGPFDLDAFSNPRSHIIARYDCQLERGDDGFGGERSGTPGMFLVNNKHQLATSDWRVFIQPPYSIVLRALRHYLHTRFCALLRFDPRPEWFDVVYDACELVCVLREIEFEPPPGIPKGGGNSFPHALYYRRAEDATPAVLAQCIAWRKKPR